MMSDFHPTGASRTDNNVSPPSIIFHVNRYVSTLSGAIGVHGPWPGPQSIISLRYSCSQAFSEVLNSAPESAASFALRVAKLKQRQRGDERRRHEAGSLKSGHSSTTSMVCRLKNATMKVHKLWDMDADAPRNNFPVRLNMERQTSRGRKCCQSKCLSHVPIRLCIPRAILHRFATVHNTSPDR